MSTTVTFFAAQLLCIFFGAAVALHRTLRRFSWASRIGAAYMAGVVALTFEAVIFALLHIKWTPLRLAVPLVIVNAVLMVLWRRPITRPSATLEAAADLSALSPPRGERVREAGVRGFGFLLCLLALAALAIRVAAGDAGTVDYVYFWGVKAVRFAFTHGIDTVFLKSPFNLHAHPNYPPLVPVNTAWSIVVAGGMPWVLAPLVGCFWIAAAVPLLYDVLRQRLADSRAMLVVVFWTAAISQSLVASFSAGGAEMQLVAAMSVACAALIVHTDARPMQILAVIGLAAALLTKVEATFECAALVAGAILANGWRRRETLRRMAIIAAIALVPLASWWVLELVSGIPLSDPIREKVFHASLANLRRVPGLMIANMEAGMYGAAWIVALASLAAHPKRWRPVLPALTLIATIFGFAFIYYLHVVIDPALMVAWTFPRLSQPALSAAIIAAGYVTFASDDSVSSAIE